MTLSLIVKGNRREAAIAAAKHGIPLRVIRQTRWNETVGQAPSAAYSQVVLWFGEDAASAPKTGSLLSYTVR